MLQLNLDLFPSTDKEVLEEKTYMLCQRLRLFAVHSDNKLDLVYFMDMLKIMKNKRQLRGHDEKKYKL